MIQTLNTRTIASTVAPDPHFFTYWIDIAEDSSKQTIKVYRNGKWIKANFGGGGEGGLTPEQIGWVNSVPTLTSNLTALQNAVTELGMDVDNLETTVAALPTFITNGDGNSYLANDGSYKLFPTFNNFEQYPTMGDFPQTGNDHVLYLDLSDGNLYYWNGTIYELADAALFNNYLLKTGGDISGTTTYKGNELATVNDIPDLTNVLQYNSNNNITLRDGTKIAGRPTSGGTNHEIFGLNEYTDSFGTFDQLEVGSQEALYNVNITYDSQRTEGHATADVYNPDGSRRSKEVFAYLSDLLNLLELGDTMNYGEDHIDIPLDAEIIYVSYNHIILHSGEYTIENNVLTLNPEVYGTIEPTDFIFIKYFHLPTL